jgi:hypothetical protein
MLIDVQYDQPASLQFSLESLVEEGGLEVVEFSH